ncbi:MAG: pepsin-like aspartic protease [Cyclobacteriaceae bacterium]|nr:peptidase A1 pepsin [Cytophagales bacterium]HNP77091.1 pepsin-like aspartic protease [Cyclobacteriaceae bacterium]
MTKPSVRIPITNIYDGNDYTVRIRVGSQGRVANVILDTGSSTLAVTPSAYDPTLDAHLKPTPLAQLIQYGSGGWAGPVVKTSLRMGIDEHEITLPRTPVAIIDIQQHGSFTGVDGILGLAYHVLNNAYDFSGYFYRHHISPPATYPWSFPAHSFKKFLVQFGGLVNKQNIPSISIEPYFDEIERLGLVANKFAFYTLRSWVHISERVATDPLNQGYFILGGGEEQHDLYAGPFTEVKVLHDVYYNTHLRTVQVGEGRIIQARELPVHLAPYQVSNSIIDSGTSYLALASDVYHAITDSLDSLNPAFSRLIHLAQQKGSVPVSELDLEDWPDVHFRFEGVHKDALLTVRPDTYWQVNYPAPGRAVFQIGPEGVQSIFGLPLLNNYYTIFDRSASRTGVIKFASIKRQV